MTMPADPVPEGPEAAPVTGTEVAPPAITVQPDQASVNAASDRARGRTSIQVHTPAAIVGIGTWLAALAGLDLDPGAGIDLPAPVAGYFVALVAQLLAARMNPKG